MLEAGPVWRRQRLQGREILLETNYLLSDLAVLASKNRKLEAPGRSDSPSSRAFKHVLRGPSLKSSW